MKITSDNELYISLLSRLIVNLFVTRITKCSIYNFNKFIIDNALKESNFPDYMLKNDSAEASKVISYDFTDEEQSFKKQMKNFESFISTKVLSSYDIQTADAHGQYVIKKIFQAYYKTPTQLPDHCVIEYYILSKKYDSNEIQKIITEKGMGEIRAQFSKHFNDHLTDTELLILMRVICNQIAGMTDPYAQKTYNNLYS